MKISKEVKVGLTGIAVLFILIYGINYLKGVDIFKSSNHMYVRFQDISGLAKSSPIYADGYKVGTVSDLCYDYARPGNVIVEIDIDPQLRVPRGSTAEITSDMLGAVRLSLLLADNRQDSYSAGDTIPGHVNGGALSEAAAMLPKLEQMLPKLDSIMASLNTLLADPSIAATLHNVENLTASLNANSRQIEGLLRNDVPRLAAKMDTIGSDLAAITGNLKQIDYAATMEEVNATLANVKQLTDRLGQNDNTVGLLLNDPTLYNNLSATAANAASLLDDLKSHPKRYVHFSLFGRKDKPSAGD